MKEYFYKKEYKYMYLSIFFYNFANALSETFGTVMLYKAGLPIYLILLIYGIRFLIMGLITPAFVTISSKIGIAKCILISNLFNIIYFIAFVANIITYIFAKLMKRKNSYGEQITAKINGFKNYIELAEKNQIEMLVEQNPDYFYNILPYTYVLNISKKWIDNFGKKNMPNIDLSALEYYENNLFMIMSE